MARAKRKKPANAGCGGGRKPADYGSALIPALVLILMTLIVLFVQRHAGKGLV